MPSRLVSRMIGSWMDSTLPSNFTRGHPKSYWEKSAKANGSAMEIFGGVGDRTVSVRAAVAEQRETPARLDDLFPAELREHDFLIRIAGFGDDFAQRIDD